jgi:uncharacterized protein
MKKQEVNSGRQLLILLGTVMLGFCLFSVLMLLVMKIDGVHATDYQIKINNEDASILGYLKKTIVMQPLVLFMLPTLLYAYLVSKRPAVLLKLHMPKAKTHLILGFLLLLVSMPLVLAFLGKLNETLLSKNLIDASQTYKHIFNILVKDMQASKNIWFMICTTGFLTGFSEELLFRAGLQNIITKWCKNHWVAIIITGFIFSAMHFEFTGFLPRFALGILLGVIYFYSNSIWPAVIAHAGFNIIQVIAMYNNVETEGVNMHLTDSRLLLSATISLVLVLLIIFAFKKTSNAVYNTEQSI